MRCKPRHPAAISPRRNAADLHVEIDSVFDQRGRGSIFEDFLACPQLLKPSHILAEATRLRRAGESLPLAAPGQLLPPLV